MATSGAEIQPESGFVRIHPVILEQLALRSLSGREFRCLMFLFRKTYGYQKKQDRISLSQWEQGTGIPRTRVGDVLDGLVSSGILKRTDNGAKRPSTWEFNKYFEQWQDGETVTLQGDSLEPSVTLQGDRLNGETVTLQGDSLEPSVTLQGDRSVTLQGDNNRKKERGNPGVLIPERESQSEINETTHEIVTNALLAVAGWTALVKAGDTAKLRFARDDASKLIRMGHVTAGDIEWLADGYKQANAWRKTLPSPRDLCAYASQQQELAQLSPESYPSNGVVKGFNLAEIMGDNHANAS